MLKLDKLEKQTIKPVPSRMICAVSLATALCFLSQVGRIKTLNLSLTRLGRNFEACLSEIL
jgi:hypothetical protein